MRPTRTAAIAATAIALAASAASAQYSFHTLLYDGQQAPSLPAGVTVSLLNAYLPALNNSGQVAVYATLAGPGITTQNNTAWWIGAPDSLELLIRRGDPAPGAADGTTIARLGRLILNDNGVACFPALMSGPIPSGIWVGTPGALQPVALAGDHAPQTADGVTFSAVASSGFPFSNESAFNNRSEVSFVASLQGPGVTGSIFGIWSGAPGNTHLVARVLAPAPGPPASQVFVNLGSPALAPDGTVAFAGYATSFGGSTNLNGVWTYSSGSAQLLLRATDQVPSLPAGYTFSGPFSVGLVADNTGWPSFNAQGQADFIAFLAGPGINGSTNSLSWWSGTRSTAAQLHRASDIITGLPGVVAQATYSGTQMQLGASGTSVFDLLTTVDNGGTYQTASLIGTPGNTSVIAAAGMPVPGLDPSITFLTCTALAINDEDTIALYGSLQGPGITSANDAAVWIGTPSHLTRLFRKGDQYTLPSGFIKVISGISISRGNAGQDGHIFPLANDGRVVATLTFTDSTRAMVLAEPTPICPGDFNHSGSIDSADFFAFISAFFIQDPSADFNHSGAVDSQDFFDFLAAFFTPCP